jgi:predicted regulator of amino acid metabolism with ACT domain
MVTVTVDLAERTLTVDTVERTLSNHTIEYLRQISDSDSFNDSAATAAVHTVIDEQIIPFLKTANREPSDRNICTEIEAAFDTHLYCYADPD